jgi:DNA-binding CsgD family transcriptional regulator
MLNGFLTAVFLTVAVAPIAIGARLLRRRQSASGLSYLAYLALWNFLAVFSTAFLLYIRYLPQPGQLGFILFNALVLIPVQAATVIVFADFLCRQLGRRLSLAAGIVLGAPFLAIFLIYGRRALIRLTEVPAPSSLQVNAPLSLMVMFLSVLALSLAGLIISARRSRNKPRSRVVPVAGLTAVGVTLAFASVNLPYTSFANHILYGIIWIAVNMPALTALLISSKRERLADADEGTSASRLDKIGESFGLSEREIEILILVHRGRLNKEIAAELHISIDTVKKHLYNVFKKTGVRNRVQLFLLISGEASGEGCLAPPAGGRGRA